MTMSISSESKEIIVKEIDFVIDKMKQTSDPEEKLFYFSAIYAMVQRILNIEYDSELICIYTILRDTFNTFIQRIKAIKTGDTTIPFAEKQMNKLEDFTKELLDKIRNDENLDDTLKKFIILYYSTTGNGYYLLQKGLLKL